MKVGLAQIRPHLGNVAKNLEIHKQMIKQAKEEGVELLIFPELSLMGYNLLDLTYDVACAVDSEEVQEIVSESKGMDIAFGIVERSSDHILYNSAIYASYGSVQAVHRKVYLPTYGMFDEARYFGRGESIRAFDTRFGRVGMLVCEDMWHPSAPYLLAQDRAELLIVLANSPARGVHAKGLGTQDSWDLILTSQAQFYGMFIACTQRVGTEDGVSFFGNSTAVDPFGDTLVHGPLFEESLVTFDLELDMVRRARFTTPILRDENTDLVVRELTRIQQHRRGE
ncbi:putative amidohydrolase [Croceifilum oryzae]|uniref:Amidohydrolase n=1 Tax=Croceifilum oryzae TaxID=1553429 RepID=A0AAJ1TIG8_9BACL|nr:nitrilase-related carbon-nitrogen hydrolase [Croceifilum oryzae]MDQ0417532.1 putative amidohydrolase [Croceifilum oryzae]